MTSRESNPILLPDHVYELRMPKTRQGTVSGYFENLGSLYQAAAGWDRKVPGLYVTLNPVNPALLARAKNRLQTHAKTTTGDTDILQRAWLLIDCDVVRPADISASDGEHRAALDRNEAVADWLRGQGWPEPVRADSGNGGHLLYRLNLPNDSASRDLVKAALEALALKFNDSTVMIDTSVFNAARITKLYGTMACKGDSTEDRPHRRSAILIVPSALIPVPEPALRQLAQLRPADPKPVYPRVIGTSIDARDFIHRHGLTVAREKPWNGAIVFELETCPFNAEHARSSSIIQFPTGALAFTCFHNSCQGIHWSELRHLLEPGRHATAALRVVESARGCAEQQELEAVITRLDTVSPELIRWLWPRRIARGKLNLLIGDPGLGKSFLMLDLAARLTTGRAWPDQASGSTGDVIILTAEDGLADTLRPRIDKLGGDPKHITVLEGMRAENGLLRGFCLQGALPALEAAAIR